MFRNIILCHPVLGDVELRYFSSGDLIYIFHHLHKEPREFASRLFTTS